MGPTPRFIFAPTAVVDTAAVLHLESGIIYPFFSGDSCMPLSRTATGIFSLLQTLPLRNFTIRARASSCHPGYDFS
jgi:hypothetical protein